MVGFEQPVTVVFPLSNSKGEFRLRFVSWEEKIDD